MPSTPPRRWGAIQAIEGLGPRNGSFCILAALLAGCGGFPFPVTAFGSKATIEVNNAEDGTAGESSPVSVGRGETAVVESALDKGRVRIDFAEATIFRRVDEPDDVYTGDVVDGAAAGAGDRQETALEAGGNILQFTAIGAANGNITVNRVK